MQRSKIEEHLCQLVYLWQKNLELDLIVNDADGGIEDDMWPIIELTG